MTPERSVEIFSKRLTRWPERVGSALLYAIFASLLTLSIAVPSAHGSEPTPAKADAWLPSATVGFGLQHSSYQMSADAMLGDLAELDSFRQNTSSGSSDNLASLFMIDVGLASPVLVESVGSMRLVFQTGFQIPMSNDYPILNDPTSYPPGTKGAPRPETTEHCPLDAVDQATELRVPPRRSSCDWNFGITMNLKTNFVASLGLDFTLPVGNREFHIRPSIEYLGQYLEFTGKASRTDRALDEDQAQQSSLAGVPYATYTLDQALSTQWLSAIGPRLTMEVDTARVGSLGLTLSIDGRLYWYTDPKPIDFSQVKSSGPGSTGQANFSIRPDPFIFQITAGFKLAWQGAVQ